MAENVYSQGSNSEHSKSESIRLPNVSKFGFRTVQTIRKPNFLHLENRIEASLDGFRKKLQNGLA